VLWVTGVILVLSMQRTVAVAAILALPLACTALDAALPPARSSDSSSRGRWAWCASALIGVVVAAPVAASVADHPVGVPTRLEAQLEALPPGTRALVDSDTSGWVLFRVPTLRPTYDLRVESYSPRQVEDYIALVGAEPGWQTVLASSGATVALVAEDAPIRAALTEELRWKETGKDAGLVLIESTQ
jgi:hypothetical protein